MKTQQIRAQHTAQQVRRPRTNSERFRIGPGDVPEDADRQIGAGFLQKMTEADAAKFSINDRQRYVKFGICKQNYDLTPPDRWMERKEGGVLLPVDLFEARAKVKSVKNTKSTDRGAFCDDDW